MSHPNARLTPYGRLVLVERIVAGYRVADVAAQLGCHIGDAIPGNDALDQYESSVGRQARIRVRHEDLRGVDALTPPQQPRGPHPVKGLSLTLRVVTTRPPGRRLSAASLSLRQ